MCLMNLSIPDHKAIRHDFQLHKNYDTTHPIMLKLQEPVKEKNIHNFKKITMPFFIIMQIIHNHSY